MRRLGEVLLRLFSIFCSDKLKSKPVLLGLDFLLGGGEGNWTPVQRSILKRHYERSQWLKFPHCAVHWQTA